MIAQGDKFYDERNDRYITVLTQHTDEIWYVKVLEPIYNDDGEEVGALENTSLFSRCELLRFERR